MDENLRSFKELRDRLRQERSVSDGARSAALNTAIRALAGAIDILESVIAHERGRPYATTNKDMDTYAHPERVEITCS